MVGSNLKFNSALDFVRLCVVVNGSVLCGGFIGWNYSFLES